MVREKINVIRSEMVNEEQIGMRFPTIELHNMDQQKDGAKMFLW